MGYSNMDLDVDDYEAEFETAIGGDDSECAFPEIDFEALGIDPSRPTLAKPGSEEKVCMLAARYAAGLPLWHDDDCVDHGPGGDDD